MTYRPPFRHAIASTPILLLGAATAIVACSTSNQPESTAQSLTDGGKMSSLGSGGSGGSNSNGKGDTTSMSNGGASSSGDGKGGMGGASAMPNGGAPSGGKGTGKTGDDTSSTPNGSAQLNDAGNSETNGSMTSASSGGAGGMGPEGQDAGGESQGGTSAGGEPGQSGGGAPSNDAGSGERVIPYVFVITMENHDSIQIVGNTSDAPYLNDTLIANYASASNFTDQFQLSTLSEPHYIWMEAGTNVFSDHTFSNDDPPSANNSTADTDHLVTQIANASNGVDWRSYQEGMNDATGACPIAASGAYAPKHDPFVYFQDVSGSPPSKTNAYCAAHHAPFTQLASDLQNASVVAYNFITPDLCHDMHGQNGCPDSNMILAGDNWLKANVPPIEDFMAAHGGVLFIVWDEGDKTDKMPFVAIGPGVKTNYVSSVNYTHGSFLKSVEEILGLPVLDRVTNDNDFADLFTPGSFP